MGVGNLYNWVVATRIMRQQSVNYFWGSVFSIQSIYAYGIAGSISTAFQMVLVWAGVFTGVPTRTDSLPILVELYLETLIPLWIPPITGWNAIIFLLNVIIAVWILFTWTVNYDRAIR